MIAAGKNFLLLVYCVVVIGQQSHQTVAQTATPTTTTSAESSKTSSDTSSGPSSSQEKYSKEDNVVIDAVETALLGLFGMKSRPRPNRKVVIPPYMYELYREHTGMDLVVDMDSVASHRRPLYTANTIRSFDDESSSQYHSGSAEESNRATLLFNISSMSQAETLKGAELRIYRAQANTTLQDLTEEELASLMSLQHRIDIYEIIKPSTRTREAITRLVDTRTVRPHRTAWESFDISGATARWRSAPHLNFGLQVHFSTRTGEASKLQHVRLKRSVATPEHQWHSQKPLVVTYSDDGTSPPRSGSRSRRESGDHRNHNKKRMARAKRKSKERDLCRRRRMYVDFSNVGWNDWIVAPPGYDAYYCHGTCPQILQDTMNTTNHAIVQNLVHAVDREATPKPCCVPTELSAISLLYVNEHERVQLKKYADMVVEACGCR